jgi:hypothetical protein
VVENVVKEQPRGSDSDDDAPVETTSKPMTDGNIKKQKEPVWHDEDDGDVPLAGDDVKTVVMLHLKCLTPSASDSRRRGAAYTSDTSFGAHYRWHDHWRRRVHSAIA